MSRSFNELSQVSVTAEPLDVNNDAYTPTTARYRVDDCRTGQQLVAWTNIAVPSSSMVIEIPGSANAIIDTERRTPEIKVVTVNTDNGLVTQHFAEYNYGVVDLGFAQIA